MDAKELFALATAIARLSVLEVRLEALPQGEGSQSDLVSINRGSGMQVFIVRCLLRHLFELVDQLDARLYLRAGSQIKRTRRSP